MSDEYREIEVVEVGSGPPRPARPPRSGNRTDVLLTLMVVGVFVGAAMFRVHGLDRVRARPRTSAS